MQGAIKAGIYAKATTDSGITALAGTRCYWLLAPASAALPVVVATLAAGGDTNETPKEELDVLIDIKGVAASAQAAEQLADAIRGAFHEADLSLGDGWHTIRCQHVTAFAYVENADNRQYWHAGGTYRIRAVKEA